MALGRSLAPGDTLAVAISEASHGMKSIVGRPLRTARHDRMASSMGALLPGASGESDVADIDRDRQRIEFRPQIHSAGIGATLARQADPVHFDR